MAGRAWRRLPRRAFGIYGRWPFWAKIAAPVGVALALAGIGSIGWGKRDEITRGVPPAGVVATAPASPAGTSSTTVLAATTPPPTTVPTTTLLSTTLPPTTLASTTGAPTTSLSEATTTSRLGAKGCIAVTAGVGRTIAGGPITGATAAPPSSNGRPRWYYSTAAGASWVSTIPPNTGGGGIALPLNDKARAASDAGVDVALGAPIWDGATNAAAAASRQCATL